MSSMSTEFPRPLSSTATANSPESPSTNPRSSSSSHCSSRLASSRSKASMLGRARVAALRLDHLSAQGAQKSKHDRDPDHFAVSRYESFIEGALHARVADLSTRQLRALHLH